MYLRSSDQNICPAGASSRWAGFVLGAALWSMQAGAQSMIAQPAGRNAMGQGASAFGVQTGSYQASFDLAMPNIRASGVSPGLNLSYNSSNGNGLLGVGWALSGLSQIQRAGSDLGPPKWDMTDIWLLDGERLYACVTGSTAVSCVSGGTHYTKHENYSLIQKTSYGIGSVYSKWTVTLQGGRYQVVYDSGNGTGTMINSKEYRIYPRYAYRLIDDGNKAEIQFTYTPNATDKWSYLTSIKYSTYAYGIYPNVRSHQVLFYYENRPDPVSLSAGGTNTISMSKRLKSVDVLYVDGGVTPSSKRIRAYGLNYITGAAGRSVLQSVKQYGKLATMDAAGVITGSHLPFATYSYSPATNVAGPELLTSIDNGMGGTTTVNYALANTQTSTALPVKMPVVTSTTVNDGRGMLSTTTMSYSTGLWDATEQWPLGFAYSKVTSPCITGETLCPYSEIWYRQDAASAGMVDKSQSRTGDGKLWSQVRNEYSINATTLPYTAQTAGTWSETFDGSGTALTCPSANCKRDYTGFKYDTYGFVKEVLSTADWDGAKRNVLEKNIYQHHTASFSHKLAATAKFTDDPSAPSSSMPASYTTDYNVITAPLGYRRLSEMQFAYGQDDDYSGNVKLVNGSFKRTHGKIWSRVNGRFDSRKNIFDSWGHQIGGIDAKGQAVGDLQFDSTMGMVVVIERAPGSQTSLSPTSYYSTLEVGVRSTTSVLDMTCLATPTTAEIGNSSKTTKKTTLDEFCRPVMVEGVGSDGASIMLSKNIYCELVSSTNQCGVVSGANAQFTEVRTPSADGTGDQWDRAYTDGLGRIYKSLSKGPSSNQSIQVLNVYNARGLLEKASEPHFANVTTPLYQTTVYDSLNRVKQVKRLDSSLALRLDYGLRQQTSTDALGHVRTVVYDAFGNTEAEQFILNGITYTNRYEYNVFGQKTKMTDAEGNVWTWGYDSTGRITTESDPDRGVRTIWYDENGRVNKVIDAKNQTTYYTYDHLGRIKRVGTDPTPGYYPRYDYWSDIVQYENFTLGYPSDQSAMSACNVVGRLGVDDQGKKFCYDSAGRVIAYGAEAVPSAFTWNYDNGGRLKYRTMPNGLSVGSATNPITYDGAGRVKTIPGLVTSVTYMADGAVDVVVYANGVTTDFDYDINHAISRIRTTKGTAVLQDLRYTREIDGKIKTITSPFPGEGWSYTYDDLNRLLASTNTSSAADNQTFNYSPSGNLTYNSRLGIYTYPAPGENVIRPHAVTQAGNMAMTYDPNGSMLTKGAMTMTWNQRNQLASVTNNGQVTTYTYNMDGSRRNKLRKQVGSNVTFENTQYLMPDFTWESVSQTAEAMVELPGGKAILRNNDTTKWAHGDHLGSPNVITDAMGAVVHRQSHRPFGERMNTNANLYSKDFDFLGERFDNESGLLYQRVRYFDPQLARYTAADWFDPASPNVGPNRYAYAGNDPVNNVDDGNAARGAMPRAGTGAYFVPEGSGNLTVLESLSVVSAVLPFGIAVRAGVLVTANAPRMAEFAASVGGRAYQWTAGASVARNMTGNLATYAGHGFLGGAYRIAPGTAFTGGQNVFGLRVSGLEVASNISGVFARVGLGGAGLAGAGNSTYSLVPDGACGNCGLKVPGHTGGLATTALDPTMYNAPDIGSPSASIGQGGQLASGGFDTGSDAGIDLGSLFETIDENYGNEGRKYEPIESNDRADGVSDEVEFQIIRPCADSCLESPRQWTPWPKSGSLRQTIFVD